MKNRIIMKHPRKAMKAMRDFLNEATYIDYIVSDYPRTVKGKRMAKVVKDKGFAAWTGGAYEYSSTFRIDFPANFSTGNGDKTFRKDLVSRFPSAKGFSTFTLSLLHELGHIKMETNGFKIDSVARSLKTMALAEKVKDGSMTVEEANFEYFKFPEEMVATNWAIEWLKDPEHRKLAKKFEREFFACYE